ncbi:MAG: archease [Deltaproteobacteria bacterium]|jgi:SHS2 domain-containing protein|nr:archease [Deltaproteobacteria bacterium]MBW2496884.1 archease [Deltaproteobacteria bacterium]
MGDAGRFQFVEGPTSDLAFEAHGATLEAVFTAAGEAFLAATVEHPDGVEARESRSVELEEPDLELLLLRFLNELVYLRDAEELLLHPDSLEISDDGVARLRGRLVGERIARPRHALLSDVKAATAHGLRLLHRGEEWIATATLDV